MVMPTETQIETLLGAGPMSSAPFLLAEYSYGAEIVELQALINKTNSCNTLVEPLVLELKDALKGAVSIGLGRMSVNMALGAEEFARAEQLISDYGVNSDKKTRTLAIPMQRITAINALAFPLNKEYYMPLIDVRVQTSFDKPLTTVSYEETRPKWVPMPNPGTWHRFPLKLASFEVDI